MAKPISNDPTVTWHRLRRIAREHGMRTLRAGAPGRYLIVDYASGQVLSATLVGLIELERALDVQVAERKLAAARGRLPREARRRPVVAAR